MNCCFLLFLAFVQIIAGRPWHDQFSQQSEVSTQSTAPQAGPQFFPPWRMQCGNGAKADGSFFDVRLCLNNAQPYGICYETSMRRCCDTQDAIQLPGNDIITAPDKKDINIKFYQTVSVIPGDSCFSFLEHDPLIGHCPRSPSGCDETKKVCLNNTDTNFPCTGNGCTCKQGYSGTDCCECASGYAEVAPGRCALSCPEGQELINGRCEDSTKEQELVAFFQQFLKWIESCW